MPAANDNLLGTYLKDRRAKLDPAAFGFPLTRRRTPGLRREEVAQRANVSATWYTWLEQGRGGAPSADVLDRIARALMLTEVEREHLFLLALGRPPEVRYQRGRGCYAATATRARRAGAQPRLCEDLHMGRRRVEPRRPAVLTDYRRARARATQHPAPHLLRSSRPRRADLIGRASRGSRWRRSARTSRAPALRGTSRHWSMSFAG